MTKSIYAVLWAVGCAAGCAGQGGPEATGERAERAFVGADDTWSVKCFGGFTRIPRAARSSALYLAADGRECVGTLVGPAALVTSAACAAGPGAPAGSARFGHETLHCSWTQIGPTQDYAAAAESALPGGLLAVALASDPSADGWPAAPLGAPGDPGESLFAISQFYPPFGPQSLGLYADPTCSASWSGGEGLSDCDFQDPHSSGGPVWGTNPLRVVGFYTSLDEASGLNRVVPASAIQN